MSIKVNKNKVFRVLYWFLASFYMLVAAGVVISVLRPGPTETQVMEWMSGMMAAMHNSMMGASMDGSETFRYLLWQSGRLSLLMMLIGIIIGVPLKVWRKNDQG